VREFSGCTSGGEGFTSLTALDDVTIAIPRTYAEFKIASPFPGIPFFDMAMTNKWIHTVELEQYTCYTPTMRIPGGPNSDDFAAEAKAAYRKLYETWLNIEGAHEGCFPATAFADCSEVLTAPSGP